MASLKAAIKIYNSIILWLFLIGRTWTLWGVEDPYLGSYAAIYVLFYWEVWDINVWKFYFFVALKLTTAFSLSMDFKRVNSGRMLLFVMNKCHHINRIYIKEKSWKELFLIYIYLKLTEKTHVLRKIELSHVNKIALT